MKVKLEQCVNAMAALPALLESNYPFDISWKMGRAAKIIEKEANEFNELSNKKLMDTAKKVMKEDGTPELNADGREFYRFETEEEAKKFYDERKEALQQEIEIPVTPISIKDLSKYEVKPVISKYLDFLFVGE